jgi:hypothetical protein
MAEVLCIYRQVKILKRTAAVSKEKKSRATRWRSSPTTRSRVSRRSRRSPGFAAQASLACDLRARAPRHGQLAGRHRPRHRQGPRAGQESPSEPRIHRISRASRRRLSGPHRDQADPRQPFRVYLQRDQSLGSPARRRTASNLLSLPSTALGSISSRPSFPNSPARRCATSASHPSKNSRIASWPQRSFSTATR